MGLLNIYKYQTTKTVKLSDSFQVLIKLNPNDYGKLDEKNPYNKLMIQPPENGYLELLSCTGVTPPSYKFKSETMAYGNNLKTILIPDYESLEPLELEFFEYYETDVSGKQILMINELVNLFLNKLFDTEHFTYKLADFIPELIIKVFNNDFTKHILTYRFRDLKLASYSKYDLDYSSNDIAKWTLTFSYMSYQIYNPGDEDDMLIAENDDRIYSINDESEIEPAPDDAPTNNNVASQTPGAHNPYDRSPVIDPSSEPAYNADKKADATHEDAMSAAGYDPNSESDSDMANTSTDGIEPASNESSSNERDAQDTTPNTDGVEPSSNESSSNEQDAQDTTPNTDGVDPASSESSSTDESYSNPEITTASAETPVPEPVAAEMKGNIEPPAVDNEPSVTTQAMLDNGNNSIEYGNMVETTTDAEKNNNAQSFVMEDPGVHMHESNAKQNGLKMSSNEILDSAMNDIAELENKPESAPSREPDQSSRNAMEASEQHNRASAEEQAEQAGQIARERAQAENNEKPKVENKEKPKVENNEKPKVEQPATQQPTFESRAEYEKAKATYEEGKQKAEDTGTRNSISSYLEKHPIGDTDEQLWYDKHGQDLTNASIKAAKESVKEYEQQNAATKQKLEQYEAATSNKSMN